MNQDWLNNICLLADSYKYTHAKQYDPKIFRVSSYFESRAGAQWDETVFFGLQYILKNYLAGKVVTQAKIDAAEEIVNKHFGKKVFPKAQWEAMLNGHGGILPICVRAVPEGLVVPTGNVLMTVHNMDDSLPWLTNYVETLLVQTWYPSTVATQSREMKKILLRYLVKTGDPAGIDFKLHDFGFRGTSCPEQAAIGGAAHLVNFKGTDTVPALSMLRTFYHADMPGFSIPASEHSTITSWGQHREVEAMRNMLEQYPDGLMACVSDSFDIYNACANIWGGTLREKVLERDGVLVVRPDSGDPPIVVCRVLQILGEKFGFTVNAKGYKVLHPKVRVIQGDGIDIVMLEKVLAAMEQGGWSADNIAFGSGGGLLQKLNRDTQRFAFKCSHVCCTDGVCRDVFKAPVTGSDKGSKRGLLRLVRKPNGKLTTVDCDTYADSQNDILRSVLVNGVLVRDTTLESVRKLAQLEE